MFCDILHFLTIMGYYSVLIPMIDFKFNFMQTKFAMLAVSRPIADKFDVLRGRLLGNHNDFHWQLGGQINHQPAATKQLES